MLPSVGRPGEQVVHLRPPRSDPLPPRATSRTSQVWAGWMDLADANVQLYDVSAQFKVPTTSCPAAGAIAAFWVGLDGWTDNTVEQAGVDAYCVVSTPSGYVPEYFDWYEMYPSNTVSEFYVSPGDTIDVSVSYDSGNGKYYLDVNDKTHPGANFSAPESCPARHTCNKSSAEVIAEDAGGGVAKGFNLADFHTVGYSAAEVISRSGTIGDLFGNSMWSANQITMKYGSTVLAQPSARNSTNNGFSVAWKHAS